MHSAQNLFFVLLSSFTSFAMFFIATGLLSLSMNAATVVFYLILIGTAVAAMANLNMRANSTFLQIALLVATGLAMQVVVLDLSADYLLSLAAKLTPGFADQLADRVGPVSTMVVDGSTLGSIPVFTAALLVGVFVKSLPLKIRA